MIRRHFFTRSGFALCLLAGCDNSVTRPTSSPDATLPVTLSWKVNDIAATDPATVVRVPLGKPLFVVGEMNSKSGLVFARAPKPYSINHGINSPPLPSTKDNGRPIVDKPDDLHVYLMIGVSHAGADPHRETGAEFGLVNQYVNPNRKSLLFSAGMPGPPRAGTYAIRIWGSFKKENEFPVTGDRNTGGVANPLREITLVVTEQAD